MKTKSTINKELSGALNSSGWKRLKSGLIGKELIAYGTEVISATEQVKEAMFQAFKFEYADWPSLISIAAINDVCVSNVEPSYIRIKLNGDYNTIYKPFDLKMKLGTVSFTNIDYCRGDDEVTLYQGVTKTMYNSEAFSELSYDQISEWEVTNIPTSDEEVNQYLVLGKALPNSVRFLATDGNLSYSISRYNPVQSGPEYELYKLRTLENGKVAVMLGNDVWGKGAYASTVKFQIFWLELTSNEFSIDGSLNFGSTAIEDFTVIGSNHGSAESIEYARRSYRQEFLKTAVVASASQIKDFVKAFSYIQDCSIVPSNGEINVYVKPTDPDDTGSFGEIESQLDIYGNIFVNHNVILGTPVEFQFLITSVASAALQKEIAVAILEEFAYSEMSMDFTVDPANVAAFIQSKFGVTTIVRFNVEQELAEDGNLMFYPLQGTIRIIENSNLIAWDTNGVLQGKVVSSPATLDSLQFGLGLGESLVNLSNSLKGTYYTCTAPKLMSGESSFVRGIEDVLQSLYSSDTNITVISTNGHVILRNTTGKTVVCEDSMFWNYPNFAFNGVRTKAIGVLTNRAGGTAAVQTADVDEYVPYMFYSNNVLHIVHRESGTVNAIDYYNVVSGNFVNYFSLAISGLSGYTLAAALPNDGNLYLFFTNGYVRVVANYDTSKVEINPSFLRIANAQLVEGTFKIFRGCTDEICIVQIINGKHKIWTANGFIKDELGILFTDLTQLFTDTTGDIPDLTYKDEETDYNKVFPILVTESRIALTRIYYDSGNKFETFMVDLSTNVSVKIIATSFYNVEDLGYVDYYNGVVSYNGEVSTIQYESSSYKTISSKNYMKLNETEPIVWK